ncbi:uncharacterized protein DS421_19g660680 [Arachis hypogaea]|uniref:Uncharacterized protein n=1 Tax=Arachis hypogaea TaxID=3818 RepID=A0A6B9VAZ3_ARAHY|nr:uncharacterized protein DS421_19g660680 [Arachis hypogaea]
MELASPSAMAAAPLAAGKTSLPPPENSADDPLELLAATGAVAGAGSKSQLLRVVIPLFMLLRKCVGLCFEAVFDFELRRKELMRRLDYGISVLSPMYCLVVLYDYGCWFNSTVVWPCETKCF